MTVDHEVSLRWQGHVGVALGGHGSDWSHLDIVVVAQALFGFPGCIRAAWRASWPSVHPKLNTWVPVGQRGGGRWVQFCSYMCHRCLYTVYMPVSAYKPG